jgi:hypothetical protein
MNNQEKVLEAVTQFPGLTASKLIELCPDMAKSTFYSAILANINAKKCVKRPKGGSSGGFTYHAQDSYAQPKSPVPMLAIGSNELIELRAWKASAIARYPDLAVAEVVLKARKIVSELAKHDKVMFTDIVAGRKDNSLAMRATVAALEGVVS